MEVIRALGQTIGKMFAADLGLTLAAIATIAGAGAALKSGWLGVGEAPPVIAIAVLASLAIGVYRGARR